MSEVHFSEVQSTEKSRKQGLPPLDERTEDPLRRSTRKTKSIAKRFASISRAAKKKNRLRKTK